jgi:hypothetical protein
MAERRVLSELRKRLAPILDNPYMAFHGYASARAINLTAKTVLFDDQVDAESFLKRFPDWKII